MPRQNRPLVRDGRIQANKKKRTDRSYLGSPAKPADATSPEADAELETGTMTDEAPEPAAAAPASQPQAASSQPTTRGASNRLPTSVRAIQQQGVRKRREFDVDALAISDTRYAMHELRRILILTAMVIVTLIVLAIVLR